MKRLSFFTPPIVETSSNDSGLGGRAQAPKASDISADGSNSPEFAADPVKIVVSLMVFFFFIILCFQFSDYRACSHQIIGGPNTGKTCLVRRFAKNTFLTVATPTIGCDALLVHSNEVTKKSAGQQLVPPESPGSSRQLPEQQDSTAQHSALFSDVSHAELQGPHIASYVCKYNTIHLHFHSVSFPFLLSFLSVSLITQLSNLNCSLYISVSPSF
jgi:hypothetical protein